MNILNFSVFFFWFFVLGTQQQTTGVCGRYRFFALRDGVLSYYEFRWAFQSIVAQHGLGKQAMELDAECKILIDNARKSAQPSQKDAVVKNPEIAAALVGCLLAN